MRRKGFTLIELLVMIAIIGIIAAIVFGGISVRRHDEELKARYIRICGKDMRVDNPQMKSAEIFDRCEVQWEMGKRLEPKPNTVILMSP